ncbi:MAG: His-Xaa-Ser system radical SAM maturase HxsB [Oscillibacter sp.]|nr:His-Xaa-Ser system radical SAM maturase HxsB [Oscillibacter sp.]
MLNYFNFRPFHDKILITNDFGNYAFLSPEDFSLLVKDQFPEDSERYCELAEKLFLYQGDEEFFLRRAQETIKPGKNYLFTSTALFIFVVTGWCNANCVYCQARNGDMISCGKMTTEMADRALDIVFSSPSRAVNIEFQGGEPLGNFEVIRHIVKQAETRAECCEKEVVFSLVSNLSLLTGETLAFIREHNIALSTSLDGDRELHDKNRPLRSGESSFDLLADKLPAIRAAGIELGAIETTTRSTLGRAEELVDTYRVMGMHSIFLRPLTPLGAASVIWDQIGYTPEEFVSFYRDCLHYLLRINKAGYFMSEGHAKIFLSKILGGEAVNYMELRSPCGASIGQMAFYHDGNVYTCDEGRMLAEMGDPAFRLGTLDDSYNELVDSPVCKTACAASVLENLPECCNCVYQPYCGVCPVINYALEKDVFAKVPGNVRCRTYKGMLDTIFDLLYENDAETIQILKNWVGGNV